jgi:glycogen debranching enzyme
MESKAHSVGARTLKRRESEQPRTVIKIGADFYIHASALTSRRATRVLVNGETFAVFEVGGDILESPLEPLGFFHDDTRYLSRFELKIADEAPYFLNSYTSRENAQLRINLGNPDLGFQDEAIELPRNSIQIERDWVITGAALFHRVCVRNYAGLHVEIPLDFLFAADFADLFEVRGFKRARGGDHLRPEVAHNRVKFLYRGLDDVNRVTNIIFDPVPDKLDPGRASFLFTLEPDEHKELEVRIRGDRDKPPVVRYIPARFDQALVQRRSEIAALDPGWSKITASHESLNSLIRRSSADLISLIRYSPKGTFLMAGIPWFATLFGRDSILTALFSLAFNPALAVGTLKTLAALQGSEVNQERDEQPGKIVHEIRGGELAATGEVPFGRYYGSIDSTPLFLWLLGRYVMTTGDLQLADELWNNAELALRWIERWGDRDGDSYVEYLRETSRGLFNQGWKDSFDGISHADGNLAKAPIALCEVQAYVYAAYTSVAEVASRLGRGGLASRLLERAHALRTAFSRDFWLEPERTVALALDADKQPCRVMASNAGHCLATGLLDREQSAAVAAQLMCDQMFSGWGVRTLGSNQRRYNPMSYHNGSVWPHDNALAAVGLGGFPGRSGVLRILEGQLRAAEQLNTGSLTELFCGFPRDVRLGPVPYPVACHPQAWSAASVFMILQTMLGLEIIGEQRKLLINSPVMPEWVEWLKIENLRVGAGAVSLLIRREVEGVAVGILKKQGDVTVEIIQ